MSSIRVQRLARVLVVVGVAAASLPIGGGSASVRVPSDPHAATVAQRHATVRTHRHAHRHHRHARARTWYVRAGARSGGTGRRRAPFSSLAAAEAVARAGDRIVLLPAPLSVAPLNGGIALKPHQSLIGAGPRVTRSDLAAAPRIENTSAAQLDGDAIHLAKDTTVANLVIGPTDRGGIYGSGVSGAVIRGNVLSATNSSCTTGFVVQPFELPTLAAGVGVPFATGLPNGWAAIMLDESRARATATIVGNEVHDAQCADGIDVRASGTARMRVSITDNVLSDLHEGATQESVLAIGLQTIGTSTLLGNVDGNTETDIGNAILDGEGDADSEGLFANSAGRSTLTEDARHNTFAHGLGHISANCFEAAASSGGPTMHITLADSSCQDVVGDILEAGNLSRDATMTFKVDHVVAEHSTFVGAEAFSQAEPGDDGDCMMEVASGADSTTEVTIEHSVLSHCVADGLGVVSNVVDGTGPVRRLSFDVQDSAITGNQVSNLRVANATPVAALDGRIEDSNLSQTTGPPMILENLDTTGRTHPVLDFGGGSLGSSGDNCLGGGSALEDVGDAVQAGHDWWGQPGGPSGLQIVATGGAVDAGDPLSGAPPAC